MRNPLHPRAGGNDDALGRGVGVAVDLDLLTRQQRAGARDDGDLVLLHQEADTLGVLFAHLARVLDGRCEIEFDLPDLHTEALGGMGQVGALEQGLAGDTPHIDAHAAELAALDHGGVQPELGAPDCTHIPGGPAAENDDVETLSHGTFLGCS